MLFNSKPTIHLISGLGDDRHSFAKLNLDESFQKNYVDWLKPMKDELLPQYSKRLIAHYHIADGDILIGCSFGGMVAVEMSKHITPHLIILISSVLAGKDFSIGFKVVSRLKLYRFLTKERVLRPNPVNYYVFGAKTTEQRSALDTILLNADPDFTLWAIRQMLNWKNKAIPENLIKIHGNKDRIFPLKKASTNHIIKGGSHLMVFNRADEVSEIINQYVRKIS